MMRSQGYHSKKEVNEWLDSLDPLTGEHIRNVKRRERPRTIRDNVLGLILAALLFAFIGTVIFKAITTEDPMTDTLFVVSMIGFVVTIAAVIIGSVIYYRKKKNISLANPVTAEGIVYRCRLAMSSNNGSTYTVLVVVKEEERFLRATVRELYEMGEKVTVEYERLNPKHCRIVRRAAGAFDDRLRHGPLM